MLRLLTPTPSSDQEDPQPAWDTKKSAKFREDVLLDFASLESSLVRIQLILDSNRRERERYAAEKARILATAQDVRESTVTLHSDLEEAKGLKEMRKGYDVMAKNIFDNKKLKAQDEAHTEIDGLDREIQDLQLQSADFDATWIARREQLDRMFGENDAMVRMIKGIKDEPEVEEADADAETEVEANDKDETMEDDDEPMKDEDESKTDGKDETGEDKDEIMEDQDESHVTSPLPNGSTPLPGDEVMMTPSISE